MAMAGQWVQYKDTEGRLYYYHTVTSEMAWEEPKEGFVVAQPAPAEASSAAAAAEVPAAARATADVPPTDVRRAVGEVMADLVTRASSLESDVSQDVVFDKAFMVTCVGNSDPGDNCRSFREVVITNPNGPDTYLTRGARYASEDSALPGGRLLAEIYGMAGEVFLA